MYSHETAIKQLIEHDKAEHVHTWKAVQDTDSTETVYWCTACNATKDSSGGIIL